MEHIPAPEYEPDFPLQAHVTNLDASPYVGRIAICRVRHGTIRRGETVAWCRHDGSIERVKVSELYVTEALDRVEATEAAAGEIISVAGIPEITIGDTLADADDPQPLPVITVDEPSLSVTIGINTSPLAGQDGNLLTASQVKARLERELIGNVSLRITETERPDVWEVQGRGELALAILVELMRREGFELTVGKPQVVTREINGKTHEPVERMSVDAPEEYVGVITQLMALRKGAHGADGQPRHRLGADGVPRPRPRADRLPHRVPHRDPRHRPGAPRVRPLGAVARRAAHAAHRFAGGRPPRHGGRVRAVQPPGARDRCSSSPATRSTRA